MDAIRAARWTGAARALEYLYGLNLYNGRAAEVIAEIGIFDRCSEQSSKWLSSRYTPERLAVESVDGRLLVRGSRPLEGEPLFDLPELEKLPAETLEVIAGEARFSEVIDVLEGIVATGLLDFSMDVFAHRTNTRRTALTASLTTQAGVIEFTEDQDELTLYRESHFERRFVIRDDFDFSPFFSRRLGARFRCRYTQNARAHADRRRGTYEGRERHFDYYARLMVRLPAELRDVDFAEFDPRLVHEYAAPLSDGDDDFGRAIKAAAREARKAQR